MADQKDPKAKPAAAIPTHPTPVHIGGESFVDRVMPHMKKIIVVALGVAAVLTVIFTVQWWNDRKRQAETTKVAAVLEVTQRRVEPAPAEGSGAEPAARKAGDPTYATRRERAEAVLAELAKQGVAAGGPLLRAGALFEAGKLDEAVAAYQAAAAAPGEDAVLAREGLGLALEAKAAASKDAAERQRGLEAALAAFQAMQPDEKGPRRAYALYHQGRVLQQLDKRDDARAALTKAKELGAGTDLPELIKTRLAALGAS